VRICHLYPNVETAASISAYIWNFSPLTVQFWAFYDIIHV